jgi:tRNA threonylcarbamoyladenosine biosynthesis protein TsaE
MIVLRTTSASATKEVAAAIAELARSGDVILLTGDLGAGKTTFAQGFGAGLGVAENITSPTFTLARQYAGRLPLHHLDVYRLEQMEEVLDLGLPELLDDDGVVLIEWGDVVAPALPADYLVVRLMLGDDDDERRIEFAAIGPSWSNRARSLTTSVKGWADDRGPGPSGDVGDGNAPC